MATSTGGNMQDCSSQVAISYKNKAVDTGKPLQIPGVVFLLYQHDVSHCRWDRIRVLSMTTVGLTKFQEVLPSPLLPKMVEHHIEVA